ncbi:sensor histidine kinase [Microbulbifer hydrolyticus]|uniref:histidine kinase n=1 Tax=Microbulbifer hydrolyticus TaxID=48074 RepID=A0A6P1T9F0_9GAMM|nr:ATP-binding protein [Microbulbifer hydrolyticus]MBB5210909.1 two-component system sensor histidine kinase PilS (NtrC family) [Microbulbifer hydrolyticus]QHQ38273.1 PAS domain-containing protein [Microbulbifer hydrolyticus]
MSSQTVSDAAIPRDSTPEQPQPAHHTDLLRPRLRQRDLLKIYAWYRVAIALVLLGLFTSGITSGAVGTLYPALYLNTAITYAILNIAWLLYLYPSRFHTTPLRIGSILGCDILAFLLLIQASGGLNSGVGYLMLTTCAVGSLLLDRRMGAFLAAIASIGVIAQQLFGLLSGQADTQDIVSAGSLGILLFTSVTALQTLSAHIQIANRKAEQERRQAAHLQRLTQQIVAQMRTGVLVLDNEHRPTLINRAAQQLLGVKPANKESLSPAFRETLEKLQKQGNTRSGIIRGAGQTELRASVTTLTNNASNSSLVFLEDNRRLAQQAQQLKLASLGRLTGSIAHEVRNPLGAIAHAAQLLAESNSITLEDRQLTEIISRHSQRVNQIVENVLQLSRRKPPEPQLLDLRHWTVEFLKDYTATVTADTVIKHSLPSTPVLARFDPSQMSQVVTNLCNNAIRHSRQATGSPEVELSVSYVEDRQCARLDILDLGDGVAEEHKDQIFEPFFTTESAGAGLGLYIARELCESTRATLYYCRSQDKRSCFRVEFACAEQVF